MLRLASRGREEAAAAVLAAAVVVTKQQGPQHVQLQLAAVGCEGVSNQIAVRT